MSKPTSKSGSGASEKPRENRLDGWIGVDLDGTLAEYHGWQGSDHVGPAIPEMLERVKRWIRMGIEVRIFTARASVERHVPPVERWLQENGIPGLKVTNRKDYRMLQLWDDRCIQVVANTGQLFKNADWVSERKKQLDELELAARESAGKS